MSILLFEKLKINTFKNSLSDIENVFSPGTMIYMCWLQQRTSSIGDAYWGKKRMKKVKR